jgi:hypothetical protein
MTSKLLQCGSARRATAQTISRQSVAAEARVQSQANPSGICCGQNGTGTGSSPSTSVFPCQYHSINGACSFIHL